MDLFGTLWIALAITAINPHGIPKTSHRYPSLPIMEDNFYSIRLIPGKKLGLDESIYVLKVFADGKENRLMAHTRGIKKGDFKDVDFKDVDHDGKSELVVVMQKNKGGKKRVFYDVYELNGEKLQWIERFKSDSFLFNQSP